MNKKAKTIAISIAIIGAGIWLVGKWLHSLPKAVNPAFATADRKPLADRDKILSLGSTGLEVGQLQNKMGGLSVDGVFGPMTEKRLKTLKGVTAISLNAYDKS